MASFGTRHIINPFDKFGEYMALALRAPAAYHLLRWLTALPGSEIARHRQPPRGKWVLCGFGGFGQVMQQTLAAAGLPVTIIDRVQPANSTLEWIAGDGTGADALRRAGIADAVGIVAATGDDVNNLSVLVTARELKRELFTVLRQNKIANRALFDAFESDFTMVASEIVAHECLALLTTPLLAPFLDALRAADDGWAEALLARLTARHGSTVPRVWSVTLNLVQAPAVYRVLMHDEARMTLGGLLRAPVTERPELECSVLMLRRDGELPRLLPGADQSLRLGDQLLLVGSERARRELELTLFNALTLQYVLTGVDSPGGLVWEWLARRRAKRIAFGEE
jgi:voltage-gated potassium channel Kch